MCRSRREPAISPACQARNFTERMLADRIVPLLEHESGNAAQGKLASSGTQFVQYFLHGIAHENERSHFTQIVFTPRVGKNFGDLRLSAPTIDARHEFAKARRLNDPSR